jgi:hypothetical protein
MKGDRTLEKRVNVEVIGASPPCKRCEVTWKNVEKAASIVRSGEVDIAVKKVDIMSKDVISRYGLLMSPAIIVNGVVKIRGRVPDVKEVETILREMAESEKPNNVAINNN